MRWWQKVSLAWLYAERARLVAQLAQVDCEIAQINGQ